MTCPTVSALHVLYYNMPKPLTIPFPVQASSKMEERQKLFYLLGQLHTEGAALYAEMLGFDAALVVPKLLEDIKASAEQN